MTKLLQQALNEAKADAIEVFTYKDGIAQSARDAIEYMHSWLGVYFEKQALAQQEQPAQEPVTRPVPFKIAIPPPMADAFDVVFAEGWNACCDTFFGGKPPPEPLIITTEAPAPARPAIKDDIGVACLETMVKTMTNLGLATDASLEGFGARLESNIYAMCRTVDGIFKAQQEQPAQEPVMYQYRWTNPGDNKDVSKSDLDWNTVEVRHPADKIESRIEELESSRYNGKPCYEVRGLFARPAPTQKALSESDILEIDKRDCRSSQARRPAMTHDEIKQEAENFFEWPDSKKYGFWLELRRQKTRDTPMLCAVGR